VRSRLGAPDEFAIERYEIEVMRALLALIDSFRLLQSDRSLKFGKGTRPPSAPPKIVQCYRARPELGPLGMTAKALPGQRQAETGI
jgi:hypothetical protein